MLLSYLTALLAPLLSNPTALLIKETTDQMGTLMTVTVAKEDMGMVIGKGGETAQSIRHLVRVVGMRSNSRVSIKVTEPDGTPYRPANRGPVRDTELVA